jgi:hypothetical protein
MNSFVVLLCVVPLIVLGEKYDTYGGNLGIDCSKLADGNYPDPGGHPPNCNTFYWVCSGHEAKKMDCQNGLYFDPDRNWCESRDNVVVCGGQQATTLPSADDVTLDPSVFDCSENEDGYFPNPKEGCSQIYYSCSGGLAKELSCQSGLIFDPETMTCNKPEETFICTGTRATTVITEAPATYAPPPQTYGMDCAGKADGSHPHPTHACSHTFFVCSNGHISMLTCAGKTYYDAKNDRCDTWRNVFACSGMEPIPAPADEPIPTAPATYHHADFDCANLPDGSHPDPKNVCSARYFDCSNGITHERHCPQTLIWNQEEGICDGFDNVFACTGVRKVITTTTMAPTSPPRVPDFICKADGSFADPRNDCSAIYWVCARGIDTKMFCAEGLKFDIESGVCDYFDNVFACSGKRPQPTYAPAPTKAPADLPQLPVDCKGATDGDYADPTKECSQIYYSCSGGVASERTCAGGLFFDAELNRCESHDDIPACSGQPRKYPSPTQPSRDIEVYPFDCSKNADGNYAAGDCEIYYWSCVGGTTYINHCPDGLAYDAEENLCDMPYQIPSCGGQRTKAPTYQTYGGSNDEPIYPVDCSKLADGSYSDPADLCSMTYYVCSNGRTSRLDCPAALKFDVTRNLCDLKVYVPACGGRVPVPETYQQNSYKPAKDPEQGNSYNKPQPNKTRGNRLDLNSYNSQTHPPTPPHDQNSYHAQTPATLPPRDMNSYNKPKPNKSLDLNAYNAARARGSKAQHSNNAPALHHDQQGSYGSNDDITPASVGRY